MDKAQKNHGVKQDHGPVKMPGTAGDSEEELNMLSLSSHDDDDDPEMSDYDKEDFDENI